MQLAEFDGVSLHETKVDVVIINLHRCALRLLLLSQISERNFFIIVLYKGCIHST